MRPLLGAALLVVGCGTRVLDASPPPQPSPVVSFPCPDGIGSAVDRCTRCVKTVLVKTGAITTCLVCKDVPGACAECMWTNLPVSLTCELCPADGAVSDLCDSLLEKVSTAY